MNLISSMSVIAALAASGCVQVSKHAGFPDVRQQVSERIGYRVHWNQGSAEDEQVAQSVRQLLAKDGLTADDAAQVALLNNRQLQAMYEDLGVAQAAVVQAGLLHNPIFEFSVGFPTSGGQTELGFSLVQDFLDVLFIPMRKPIAEADFEATKLRVTAAVMDHAAMTRIAFYRIQADEQLLEMFQQVMRAATSTYDAASRLHDAGNIRDLDLYNEQALYEQAKLDLARASAAIGQDREQLKALMGVWGADTEWKMAIRLADIPDQRVDLDEIEKRAVATSIDLALARKRIESVGRKVGLTKALALLAEVELGAAAEREEGEWQVSSVVGLPVPLFDQGQAMLASTRSELRRQHQEYAALAVGIRSAARAVRERLVTSRRSALHYHTVLLPLQQQILDETLLEYNAMQLGVFQLLTAKRQQIETGRRYIEALYDYWRARVELEQILNGRLPDLNPNEPMMAAMSTSSMGSAA